MIIRTCDKCGKKVENDYKNILFKLDYGNTLTQDWCLKCLNFIGFNTQSYKQKGSTIEKLFEEFIELCQERIENEL